MTIEKEILGILDVVLCLRGRASSFQTHTLLLGAVPELDSMAVLGIITSIEERFGFTIHDDEIDGAVFATLGSLVDFVQSKLAAQ